MASTRPKRTQRSEEINGTSNFRSWRSAYWQRFFLRTSTIADSIPRNVAHVTKGPSGEFDQTHSAQTVQEIVEKGTGRLLGWLYLDEYAWTFVGLTAKHDLRTYVGSNWQAVTCIGRP